MIRRKDLELQLIEQKVQIEKKDAEIQSLRNRLEEANAIIAGYKKRTDSISEALTYAESIKKQRVEQADKLLAEAKLKADEIIKNAEKRADEIKAEAEKNAVAAVDEAREKANAVEKELEDKIASVEKQYADMNTKLISIAGDLCDFISAVQGVFVTESEDSAIEYDSTEDFYHKMMKLQGRQVPSELEEKPEEKLEPTEENTSVEPKAEEAPTEIIEPAEEVKIGSTSTDDEADTAATESGSFSDNVDKMFKEFDDLLKELIEG